MTIKTIITEPNEILRQVSKPVQTVGNEERKLMDDMLETMYAANGIGLAAIQIGIPKRIIVMDISKDGKKNPMYFVNPIIKNKDKEKTTYEEGCLSVPDYFAEVDRPKFCKVEYFSRRRRCKIKITRRSNPPEFREWKRSGIVFVAQWRKNNRLQQCSLWRC